MSLANSLTLSRVISAPILLIFLKTEGLYLQFLALLIFVLASITDFYDGRIARSRKEVSNWGKFMDPLADKVLTSAVFICFVGLSSLNIPAWMVALIVFREFMVTGLRLVALERKTVIAAQKKGKTKTTFQITTIITILFLMILKDYFRQFFGIEIIGLKGIGKIIEHLPYFLMLATTILTLYTGTDYCLRNRHLFRESSQ